MKYYKIFLLIFLFISCDNISVNYPTNNSANFNSAKNDTISQNIQYVDSTLLLLFKKIDLKQIKLKYGRGSTSTYLSNLNSFHFNNSDTVGFWGMYFLSNNYDDIVLQPYIAKVVVYVKSKSKIWEFSNNDEILYEITSCHPIINTISIINIGDSKENNSFIVMRCPLLNNLNIRYTLFSSGLKQKYLISAAFNLFLYSSLNILLPFLIIYELYYKEPYILIKTSL